MTFDLEIWHGGYLLSVTFDGQSSQSHNEKCLFFSAERESAIGKAIPSPRLEETESEPVNNNTSRKVFSV